MRAKDWSATALGAARTWPQSLQTAVQIMLTSRYAMWMGWGAELTFFYNDAYRPTLALKHPDALGKPATYDPRQDAAVRLHASRLRQKLDDYYRNEGKSDSLIVELPKGRFKMAWHPRDVETLPVAPRPRACRSGPCPPFR